MYEDEIRKMSSKRKSINRNELDSIIENSSKNISPNHNNMPDSLYGNNLNIDNLNINLQNSNLHSSGLGNSNNLQLNNQQQNNIQNSKYNIENELSTEENINDEFSYNPIRKNKRVQNYDSMKKTIINKKQTNDSINRIDNSPTKQHTEHINNVEEISTDGIDNKIQDSIDDNNKNKKIPFTEKVKIFLVSCVLIVFVYFALQHVIMELFYNPNYYDSSSNPFTRLYNTMRGIDSRNIQ